MTALTDCLSAGLNARGVGRLSLILSEESREGVFNAASCLEMSSIISLCILLMVSITALLSRSLDDGPFGSRERDLSRDLLRDSRSLVYRLSRSLLLDLLGLGSLLLL